MNARWGCWPGVVLATWLTAGCGDDPGPAGENAVVADAEPAAAGIGEPPATKQQDTSRAAQQPASPAKSAGLAGRAAEISNPDDVTVLFLFYGLAGLEPPLDRWVELDNRVKMAPPRERADQRQLVRAQLEAGIAAVRDVGLLRLSLNSARMSPYDPTYGEFMIGALSPSSVIEFKAYNEIVSIKFGNARIAQIWKVPEAEAQVIQDSIGQFPNVAMDVLMQIQSVLPRPGGGTITANVLEYELRENRAGATIGRVQVP